MIKFAAILLLVIIGWRWALGVWPWDYLKASTPRDQQLSRARRLLGVEPNAGPDRIREAHRRIASEIHPDRGGSDARLAEINTARDLLIDEATKNEKD